MWEVRVGEKIKKKFVRREGKKKAYEIKETEKSV